MSSRRDTVILLAAQSFYRLSGFVLVMVMARTLPASTIGAFAFAVAFAESFVAIANFGMNPVMSRRVAADNASVARNFSSLLGFRLASSVAYLVIVNAIAFAFTDASWKLMLAATVIALAEDMYYSFGAMFLALRKAIYNVSLGMTVQIVFILLFLAGMYMHPSLRLLVGVNAFRAVSLLVVAAMITQWKLFRLNVSWDSSAIKIALPFVAMAAVTALRDQIGSVLLGLLSTYDAVAHYNLVYRVLVASLAIPTAVCAVLSPLLVAHGLDERNRGRIKKAATFILLAALAGSVITAVFAEPVARVLYGPLAPETTPLLRVLAWIFPISFLAMFCALVLQALYREHHVLRTIILVAGTNLLANLFLIPPLGAKGAVYSQLIAATVQLIILGWDLLQVLGRGTSPTPAAHQS